MIGFNIIKVLFIILFTYFIICYYFLLYFVNKLILKYYIFLIYQLIQSYQKNTCMYILILYEKLSTIMNNRVVLLINLCYFLC